jgi:membrane associated rhomboid family serine protease
MHKPAQFTRVQPRMSTDPDLPTVSRIPLILLALLTVAVLGGPLSIGVALRGGQSPDWPPDRLIEWIVFAAACAHVAALFFATLIAALYHKRAWQDRMEQYRRQRGQ